MGNTSNLTLQHTYIKKDNYEKILIQQNLCYFSCEINGFTVYFIYFILQYLEDLKSITVGFKTFVLWTKQTHLYTQTRVLSQVQHDSC